MQRWPDTAEDTDTEGRVYINRIRPRVLLHAPAILCSLLSSIHPPGPYQHLAGLWLAHQLSSPVEYRHRRSCESRGICPFISNFSGSRRRTVHSSVYNFIKISYPVTISGTVCLYPSTLRLGSHCNILREMLAKCNSAIRLPFKVFPLGSTVSIVTAFQEA